MSDLQAHSQTQGEPGQSDEIVIGKTTIPTAGGKECEAFTMTLAGETITLLPLRNWSQQDVFKWRARGKIPGTPAGLEITFDHVKITGETVSTTDPSGPARLQRLLNDWLALEKETLELARQKARSKAAAPEPAAASQQQNLPPRFRVEADKEDQVHITCAQGKEVLATIGLSLAGFSSLHSQGLIHKPHSIKVGALHDWVELDGDLFSFEKGNNDSARLEKVLNERYLSEAALGRGKDVVVSPNAASPTGFDIQFAAKSAGVVDNRKRHLVDESLQLMQDPDKCGVVPRGIVIKLSPPNLILKQKTPDGGERYLDQGPQNTVTVVDDDGVVTTIDLSQPVNYLRLSAVELTALFNHPAVNQHATASPQANPPPAKKNSTAGPAPAPAVMEHPLPVSVSAPPQSVEAKPPITPPPVQVVKLPALPVETPAAAPVPPPPPPPVRPLPNLWLKPILAQPSIRFDWFGCLVYRQMAEYFGSSHEDRFGTSHCWASSLGEIEDVMDPAFKGVFVTDKGGLGFLNQGHVVRFPKGVAMIGTAESVLEGIGVDLVGVGIDSQGFIVFIVSDDYRHMFGVPEPAVAEALTRLAEYGALLMNGNELLQSPEPLEVVWTVPAEQENPDDPQALESFRPGTVGAETTQAEKAG